MYVSFKMMLLYMRQYCLRERDGLDIHKNVLKHTFSHKSYRSARIPVFATPHNHRKLKIKIDWADFGEKRYYSVIKLSLHISLTGGKCVFGDDSIVV